MDEQILKEPNLVLIMNFGFSIMGLFVGRILNTLIHRLPLKLEREWAQDCVEFMTKHSPQPIESPHAINLFNPPTNCIQCQHASVGFFNMPILSYFALRGRCPACKGRISPRRTLVELICAGMFYFCASQWGFSISTIVWCGFCAALIALAFIDWDTTLLPDSMTLSLMWAGLILAALQWGTGIGLHDAVWGAVLGYGSLWSVYWIFKILTGKEGMGYGDFKLLAALGAWFGWMAVLPIVLMASILGAIAGLLMKWRGGLREGGYLPFGPFLALSGFASLFWGSEVILHSVGVL